MSDIELIERAKIRTADYVQVDDTCIDSQIEAINSDLQKSRKTKRQIAKRRKLIRSRLIVDWGLWKGGDSTNESSTSRACKSAEEQQILADPYSQSGLSDYLSEMIQIDQAVDKLNRHEKDLIKFEFIPDYVEQISGHVFSYSERIRYWCSEYGIASPSTYRSTKSKALDKIVDLMIN